MGIIIGVCSPSHANVLLLALHQLETLIRVSMKEPPDLGGVRRCFLALPWVTGTTSLFFHAVNSLEGQRVSLKRAKFYFDTFF